MILVSSWPARPTNGSPWASSSAPGLRPESTAAPADCPRRTRSACVCEASSSQAVQAATSVRTISSESVGVTGRRRSTVRPMGAKSLAAGEVRGARRDVFAWLYPRQLAHARAARDFRAFALVARTDLSFGGGHAAGSFASCGILRNRLRKRQLRTRLQGPVYDSPLAREACAGLARQPAKPSRDWPPRSEFNYDLAGSISSGSACEPSFLFSFRQLLPRPWGFHRLSSSAGRTSANRACSIGCAQAAGHRRRHGRRHARPGHLPDVRARPLFRAGRYRRHRIRRSGQPDRRRSTSRFPTAIESADVILFVVDTRAGLTPLDQEVARRLRYVDTPVICVANKADDHSYDTPGRRVLQAGPRQADLREHDAEPRSAATARHDRRAAAQAAGRRAAAAQHRVGDEGGHRRPPQRRQEHVRQHAGPGRADDRQRGAGTTRDASTCGSSSTASRSWPSTRRG